MGYSTADGSASSASDYVAAAGTLTFNPGETNKTLAVTVNADSEAEPDETFFVNLTSATNGNIISSQGEGKIVNDDVTTVPGLQYYPLPRPVRLLDTRPGEPACVNPGSPLQAGAPLPLQARTTCSGVTIPPSAMAVVGNATVVNDGFAGAGYAQIYPSGAQRPTVSNLNYVAGQVVPNSFVVGLGGDGQFNVYALSATHFIVDVTGYYAQPGAGGLYYHPLPRPVRLLDTRIGEPACDAPGSPLQGGAARTQAARRTCDGLIIPDSARAIVGNGTVVNPPSGGEGFVTLYPSGEQRPTVSNLNYVAGQVVPNSFTVGLGADGAFQIYAQGTTDFVVDVTGYYSDSAAPDPNLVGGLLYHPLSSPVRLLDTRPGEPACFAPGAPLSAAADFAQQAVGACSGQTIPAAARSVVGNATVVNDGFAGGGFVTLYPSGAARPTVSNLNYVAGQVVPNSFVVGLGTDGQFNVYAQTQTHFIVDLSGYFAP